MEMGPRVDGKPAAKEMADQIIGPSPEIVIADGAFRYRYRVLRADPLHSNWYLEFYRALHFFVSVAPAEGVAKGP